MADKKELKKKKSAKKQKVVKQRVRKMKGKKWFTILAPTMFDKVEIGKTIADSPESIIGRKVNVSMMELTGDFKKYYMKMSFKVTEVKESQALTEFAGSQCLGDYITRMVYRRSRRVDTVQDLETKDGKKIRVKTITILPRRVKSSIQTAARNKIRGMIKEEVESSSLEEFVEKMLNNDIKNRIYKEASVVYPIRNFEIRKTEVTI
jgi:small subunit ribosomal protein S3Ae